MVEIRRILCPIDFSDFSRHALDHAVAIGRWYDSTITLLHIRPLEPVVPYTPAMAPLPSTVITPEDREALLAAMKRFAETEVGANVPLEVEIGQDGVAGGILARATDLPADLVVMGTHGRSGFERLVLGSVTDKVLRRATCPVLSVPARIQDAVPAPSMLFTRILCAIDFSECSMQALTYAMSLAQEANANLTVLHVVEVPSEAHLDLHETVRGGPHSLKDFAAAAHEERRARLQEAVPETVRAYCTVDSVMATGKPYREILRVTEERGNDLVVIGIHGRGAADLLFFGSTAQHVVRQATCPVLTVRTG